jgi:membrane dipeptidase
MVAVVPPDALHADAVVVDGVDVSVPSRERLERLRRAGVTAANVTLAVHEGFEDAARNLVAWQLLLAAAPELALPVRAVDDISAAKATRRVGIVYGFQNATPFEDELGFVELWTRLGVRIVQLAYMYRNLVGAGCLEADDPGLSLFGRDVVRELNRCGVAIDLSHCGPRTTLEAIELSAKPVLFTHANARALVDTPRNKSDAALTALAARGGVVGAVAFRSFLAPPGRTATLADLVDHVDYLVNLLGPDHVSLATDFTEGREPGFLDRGLGRRAPAGLVPEWPWLGPEGFETVDDFPRVTRALLDRGYDEATVRKLLGGNLLRVFGEAWERG